MASNPQSKGKYWLAGHTDSQITYDEVKELATISETEFGILNDVTASAAEINKMDGVNATTDEINAACDVLTETVTTTNVIAASETGTHFVLNTATAFVSTLPAAAAGLEFWFHAGVTQVTGGNHTIITNGSANVIVGSLSSREDAAGVVVCHALADTISFIADKAVLGDLAHVWSDGTYWYLDGHCFVQDGMTTTQAS